jgi:hypothetical protein
MPSKGPTPEKEGPLSQKVQQLLSVVMRTPEAAMCDIAYNLEHAGDPEYGEAKRQLDAIYVSLSIRYLRFFRKRYKRWPQGKELTTGYNDWRRLL